LAETTGTKTCFGIRNVGDAQGKDEGGVGTTFRSWSGWHVITSASWGVRRYEGELGNEASEMRSMVCSIEKYGGSPVGWGKELETFRSGGAMS
jgi:hypothetical protein